MIDFFKKYNYDIVKVFLNQFCIALLATVMTFFAMSNNTLFVVTNLGCAVFYIYLLYTMFYEMGKADKPSIDGGRNEFKPLKGLWISLAGNAVCIICGIMVAVFSFFVISQSPVAVLDADGNEIKVYQSVTTAVGTASDETSESAVKTTYDEVSLFSNEGGEVRVESYDRARECQVIQSVKLYDEDGNELRFYADTKMKLSLTQELSTDHWASTPYSVARGIAIFLQMMFVGFKDWFSTALHISPDFYYLLTPILPVAFSAIGYCNGAKGKRILFFLPERKQKPRY